MIPVLLLVLATPAAPASERAPSGCLNVVNGGGFEGGAPNPHWTESSSNSLPIICSPGNCGTGNGTAGPRSGIWWGWLGGISGVEESGKLTQAVAIPEGFATLRLYLWNGASSGSGQDYFRVVLDQELLVVFEGDPTYTGGYAEVELDVSNLADGGTHTLLLDSLTYGDGVTNFSVDDVSIVWCPPPTLSVSDATVSEGNAGSSPAAFTVSLSQPSSKQVTVSFATAAPGAGSAATPGVDYTAASGTLSFPPGTLTRAVTVPVLGDTLDEPDESFAVNLSAPVHATLADGSGLGTIADDDAPVTLAIDDVVLSEGGGALFTVLLSAPSGLNVTASYATADGTALAGTDYTAQNGSLSIPAGSSSASLAVAALGDLVDEVDETFVVDLQAPANATLADAQGQATIDDDDGPAASIGDATVTEGDAGTVNAVFRVTLSAASVQTIAVDYSASDGTATAGSDYTAASGTLSFAPGTAFRTLAIPVLGDAVDEPDETFHVTLTGAADASLADPFGLGRILDDDGGVFRLDGELVHGSGRWEDLAALPGPVSDRDIFLLERPGHSSFEVVVDGTSGDVGNGAGPLLQRIAPDLSTVLQGSVPAGTGSSRSLRMENGQGVAVTDYVQVTSAGCSTDCDPADVYRIRAWETTEFISRFNNSASQVTLLVLGNATSGPVNGSIWFRDASGTLLGSSAFALPGLASLALNTTAVLGVGGQGGTIAVSHDGPYGALVGKAVAVEPSTGFTFDTPLLTRPR